jgi:hypothetical protein
MDPLCWIEGLRVTPKVERKGDLSSHTIKLGIMPHRLHGRNAPHFQDYRTFHVGATDFDVEQLNLEFLVEAFWMQD